MPRVALPNVKIPKISDRGAKISLLFNGLTLVLGVPATLAAYDQISGAKAESALKERELDTLRRSVKALDGQLEVMKLQVGIARGNLTTQERLLEQTQHQTNIAEAAAAEQAQASAEMARLTDANARAQLQAAQKMADAANAQLQQAETTRNQSQRARLRATGISIDRFRADEWLDISLQLENTGQLDPTAVFLAYQIYFLTREESVPLPPACGPETPSRGPYVGNRSYLLRVPANVPRELHDEVSRKVRYIAVSGRLCYDDRTGNNRETEFCFATWLNGPHWNCLGRARID